MESKPNIAVWLPSSIAVVTLFLSLAAGLHSLGLRLNALEAQAAECRQDHRALENLKLQFAGKNPDAVHDLLGAKSPVHTFGFKLLGADVAADAAEMPALKVPVAAEKK